MSDADTDCHCKGSTIPKSVACLCWLFLCFSIILIILVIGFVLLGVFQGGIKLRQVVDVNSTII